MNTLNETAKQELTLKDRLLEEAARKEVHKFYQIDGFADMKADCIFSPDRDKDCLSMGEVMELKNSTNEVRVLIHENAEPEDVIRLLKKIRKWIKQKPKLFNSAKNSIIPYL